MHRAYLARGCPHHRIDAAETGRTMPRMVLVEGMQPRPMGLGAGLGLAWAYALSPQYLLPRSPKSFNFQTSSLWRLH